MDHRKCIDILESSLLPSMVNMFGDLSHTFVFQDNNAACHRQLAVSDRLDQHDIRTMMWPAPSPDVNILEYICDLCPKQS